MDIFEHDLIENGLIITKLSEVEAFFLPLLFENEKRSAGSEIIDSKYDSDLMQLVVVFSDSRAVRNVMQNFKRIDYRGQEYTPHRVDKRKLLIKLLQTNTSREYVTMLSENIFQDFLDATLETSIVGDGLVLASIDQDIDFKIVSKRVHNLYHKGKFSVHLIANNTTSDNYNTLYQYTNGHVNNLSDLRKYSIKKQENKECQTDNLVSTNTLNGWKTGKLPSTHQPLSNTDTLVDLKNHSNEKRENKECQTDKSSSTPPPPLLSNTDTDNSPPSPARNNENKNILNGQAQAGRFAVSSNTSSETDEAYEEAVSSAFLPPKFFQNPTTRTSTTANSFLQAAARTVEKIMLKRNHDNQSTVQTQSTINSDENLNTPIECHEDVNTNLVRRPSDDVRHLNSVLSKRIDTLEERMKQYEDKLKELSDTQRTAAATTAAVATLNNATTSNNSGNNSTENAATNQNVRANARRTAVAWRKNNVNNTNPVAQFSAMNESTDDVQETVVPPPHRTNSSPSYDELRRRLDAHRQDRRTRTSAQAQYRFPTELLQRSTSPEEPTFRYEEIIPPYMRVRGAFAQLAQHQSKLTKEQINRFPVTKYSVKNNGSEEDCCPICLEAFKQNDEMRRLSCFDKFHTSCIDTWLSSNSKCPCCKHDLLQHLNQID